MSLVDFLDAVERRRKTLVVYAPAEETDVVEQFSTRNVSVEYEPLPDGGPAGFVTVREDDDFVGSIGLPELREILDPPIRRPWNPAADAYGALYEVLDETLFATFDRRQLLAAAREIENRAWRVGRGTLRVGFQALSALRAQVPVYERLAAETDLEIHLYGRADWDPPPLPDVTVHTERGEIGRFWFLAFDGGDDPLNACALLAEERSDDEFYGFWTYEAGTVDSLLDYLSSTYG